MRVGGGRGFVVEKGRERVVITAAHCLTAPVTVYGEIASEGATLPPAHGAAGSDERSYAKLIGPLDTEPYVSVECLFVDPVADLAVLGPVDGQELYDEARAYDEFIEPLDPLPLGSLTFGYRRHKGGRSVTVGTRHLKLKGFVDPTPIAESDAWLLALTGRWFRCRVGSRGRTLWISDAEDGIRAGMSGSPIMLSSGHAIGVVCLGGAGAGMSGGSSHGGGPNPLLAAQLPGWLAGGLLDIPARPTETDKSFVTAMKSIGGQ